MAVCSVRSSGVLYIVVVSMVVLSQAILCPVVLEWWAGADWLWEKSSGLYKWSLEWHSCSLISENGFLTVQLVLFIIYSIELELELEFTIMPLWASQYKTVIKM